MPGRKPIKYILREKIPRRGGNTESCEAIVQMASVIIFMVVEDIKILLEFFYKI